MIIKRTVSFRRVPELRRVLELLLGRLSVFVYTYPGKHPLAVLRCFWQQHKKTRYRVASAGRLLIFIGVYILERSSVPFLRIKLLLPSVNIIIYSVRLNTEI